MLNQPNWNSKVCSLTVKFLNAERAKLNSYLKVTKLYFILPAVPWQSGQTTPPPDSQAKVCPSAL